MRAVFLSTSGVLILTQLAGVAMLLSPFSFQQEDIGCYIEGECRNGTLVGFGATTDAIACHVMCEQEAPSCVYWSFYSLDDGLCLLYSDVCVLDEIVDGVISGDVSDSGVGDKTNQLLSLDQTD